jgi:putative chitinase
MTDTPLIAAARPLAPGGHFTQTEVNHLVAVEQSFAARAPQAPAPGLAAEPTAPMELVRTGLKDPGAFFTVARGKDLLGNLDQGEVDGCNAILEACGQAGWPIGDTAYALGTAFHETAGTMQPIKEYGGTAYFTRMYDITVRPQKAAELGNTQPGDGPKYCGRGDVQLTGKKNYAKADAKLHALGVLKPEESLVANPDLAMRQDVAAAIMVWGMREGWFTHRDLDDDIPRHGLASMQDFVRSRDIINGTDKADQIAREAMSFQTALQAGGWS